MKRLLALVAFSLSALLTPGCTLHSSATHWNGTVGGNGAPVHVKTSTNIGVNLLIGIPLIGGTTIDRMVDSITKQIAVEKGNKVRLIETSTENYWYGFPPFTWILTPVITTIAADFEPSSDVLAKALEEEARAKAK